MKVLIIEDEQLGAENLQQMLYVVNSNIQVLAITDSITGSVEWLQLNPAPDLIFMDIELADGQSFEIFNRTEIKSPVIFTTSYDEYALKAFKVNSIDYLLKPIAEADIRKSLHKVESLKQQLTKPSLNYQKLEAIIDQLNGQKHLTETKDRFLVKLGQRFFSVTLDQIAFFFSKGKLTYIRTKAGKEHAIDYTLDELEIRLPSNAFYRLNRQVLASHGSIEQINTWFNGKLKVILSPSFDEEVIVSREKAKEFRQWMGE